MTNNLSVQHLFGLGCSVGLGQNQMEGGVARGEAGKRVSERGAGIRGAENGGGRRTGDADNLKSRAGAVLHGCACTGHTEKPNNLGAAEAARWVEENGLLRSVAGRGVEQLRGGRRPGLVRDRVRQLVVGVHRTDHPQPCGWTGGAGGRGRRA